MLENHVGNVRLMQKLNRLKVLNIVRRGGKMPRATIGKLSGLSLSSVTNVVNYLMSLGLILDFEREPDAHVGRRAAILEFNYAAYSFVCCAVTKSEIVTAVCAMNGDITDKRTASVSAGCDIENIIFTEINKLISAHSGEKIIAAGVAISAMVLDGGNTVFSSTLGCNLHGVADRLKQKLSLPVIIENLSITNAVYHACESFNTTKNLLFIDFIGGIGAVQLFCGEVNRAFAGEIGHTTVDPKSSAECVCGNSGCLEVVCSLERLMNNANVKSLVELAEKFISGDRHAADAVTEYTEYLGIAVANLIDTLGPDKIILNGAELFGCREIYDLFRSKVEKRAYAKLMEKTDFTLTRTSGEQAICGMALHLCEVVFDISFEESIIE